MQFISTSNSSNPGKLKTQLKLACGRIRVAVGKKNALIRQRRRAIAELLLQDTDKSYESARQKATSLWTEERSLGAYELVSLQCEILSQRSLQLKSTTVCPPDLVTSVSTLIWVASCSVMGSDVPELLTIRQLLAAQCGKTFVDAAQRNQGGRVEERVYYKLSNDTALDQSTLLQIHEYMEDIAREYGVDWTAPPIPEPEDAPQERAAPFLLPAVTGHEGDVYDSRDEAEQPHPLPFNLRIGWVNSLLRKS